MIWIHLIQDWSDHLTQIWNMDPVSTSHWDKQVQKITWSHGNLVTCLSNKIHLWSSDFSFRRLVLECRSSGSLSGTNLFWKRRRSWSRQGLSQKWIDLPSSCFGPIIVQSLWFWSRSTLGRSKQDEGGSIRFRDIPHLDQDLLLFQERYVPGSHLSKRDRILPKPDLQKRNQDQIWSKEVLGQGIKILPRF